MKVYWIRRTFEVDCDSLQTISKTISRYPTTNLLKFLFFFSVCMEGQKRDGSKLLAKLAVHIHNYDYFHIKISLKLFAKFLLHSAFLLITWNTNLNALSKSWPTMRTLVEELLLLFWKICRISWFIWQSIFYHF